MNQKDTDFNLVKTANKNLIKIHYMAWIVKHGGQIYRITSLLGLYAQAVMNS